MVSSTVRDRRLSVAQAWEVCWSLDDLMEPASPPQRHVNMNIDTTHMPAICTFFSRMWKRKTPAHIALGKPAVHGNHSQIYAYSHRQRLKVYQQCGSGDDLPEYPTTARVHVEIDACLIPRAYPAYMTSRQAFNCLYVRSIVLYRKSSLTSLNRSTLYTSSSPPTSPINTTCHDVSSNHLVPAASLTISYHIDCARAAQCLNQIRTGNSAEPCATFLTDSASPAHGDLWIQ